MIRRNWALAGTALLALASSVLAFAFRFRLEHQHGTAIVRGATALAIVAAVVCVGLALRWGIGTFGAVCVVAVLGVAAFVFQGAWSATPCRYQRCITLLSDLGELAYLCAAAVAIAILAAWCVLQTWRRSERATPRVGDIAFLVILMSVAGVTTMDVASRHDIGTFFCGPLLPYSAQPSPSTPPAGC